MPCVSQSQWRIRTDRLPELLGWPDRLQTKDMLSNRCQMDDLVTACLQSGPLGFQSPQQVVVARRQDEFCLRNLHAMDQRLGGQIGVDEGRCSADSQQTHPGAHHIRGVDHVKDDMVTWPDALGEEPLGELLAADECLRIGQRLCTRPDGLSVGLLGGSLLKEVIAADSALFACRIPR